MSAKHPPVSPTSGEKRKAVTLETNLKRQAQRGLPSALWVGARWAGRTLRVFSLRCLELAVGVWGHGPLVSEAHLYSTERRAHTVACGPVGSTVLFSPLLMTCLLGGCRSDGAPTSEEGHPRAGQQPPPVRADEEPHVLEPGGGARSHLLAL